MSEEKQIYACKDCAHSYRALSSKILFYYGPDAYKCRLTKKTEVVENPVTGRQVVEDNVHYCATERQYGKCGIEGKFWSPRKKKDLFKLLRR